MQYFKGDAVEKQYYNSASSIMDDLSLQKDEFFENSYEAYSLGEVIYDSGRAPLANAIKREIFRVAFSDIFDAFISGGSFESYLTVFTSIFGDDVSVVFTVPAAGKLTIEIEATGLEISDLVARRIVSNLYVYDEIVDWDGDNIVLQTVKGFQSEYELNAMLFEMVPAGVFTTINLTLGV